MISKEFELRCYQEKIMFLSKCNDKNDPLELREWVEGELDLIFERVPQLWEALFDKLGVSDDSYIDDMVVTCILIADERKL